MTRNDPHARGQLADNVADVLRHPFHVAACFKVDNRKPAIEEVVAHVYDVRAGKEDDAVAVSAAVREVYDLDLFAVKKDGDRVVESDDRQGLLRRGRRSAIKEFRFLFLR